MSYWGYWRCTFFCGRNELNRVIIYERRCGLKQYLSLFSTTAQKLISNEKHSGVCSRY